MVSDFILRAKEFWIYKKLQSKFKGAEISKLNITVTRDNFTYTKKKKKLEFGRETLSFPNIVYLLIWSLITSQSNDENMQFKRSEAKGMDMMFAGPGVPGRENYVYKLEIQHNKFRR